MSSVLCRLCLNSDNVVDIFHPDFTNSEHLQTCILLATGINICRDDVVTKYVCSFCCDTALKLYTFRVNALTNDKALKLACNQTCDKVSANVEDVVAMNASIVKKLLKKVGSTKQRTAYAVHPSVVRLFKSHQNLILPNEILRENLEPRVYLKPFQPLDVLKAKRPGINIRIVKVPESRKRPAETEDSQNKKSKVMNDLVVNSTQNLNVELKPKPSSANVSYKIVESDPGKENLNSTNKIILARVTEKELNDAVPNSSDCVSSEDQTSNISPPPKRLRPRKPGPSFCFSDYEYDSDDDFLLEALEEEDAFNCELCNKSFDQKLKLKAHMRYHKNCLACNIVFRSSDALLYHQTNVCFKRLTANLPTLCLPKCDDSAEIASIKSQNPNIELNLEKEDDELLCISDNEESTSKELSVQEENYIKNLFGKHKNKLQDDKVIQPAMTHNDQQTDLLINSTINANESQIKIEGMFTSLKSVRVPIILQVKQNFGAHLEATPILSTVPKIETWTGKPKQTSKPRIVNGNQHLRVQPTPVPMTYRYPQINQPFVIAPGQNQHLKPQKGNNVVQTAPQMNSQTVQFMGHLGLNYVQPLRIVATQQSNQAQPLLQLVRTTQPYCAPARQNRAVQNQAQTLSQKPTGNNPQMSTSNETQGPLGNGFLRVKAPWELM